MKEKPIEKSIGDFENKGWRKLLAAIANKTLIVETIDDQELIEFRRTQCWKCEQRDKENQMCKLCGCFLSEKTKSKVNRTLKGIEITHCPLGKWNDKEIADHYKRFNVEEIQRS